MKKFAYTSILLLSFALVACSSTSTSTTVSTSESKTSESSTTNTQTTTASTDSMQVASDQKLEKIGQWKQADGLGKLELVKISNAETSIELMPGLTLTIKDVKILHADNISELNPMLIKATESSGNIVQLRASVVNNTDTEYRSIFPRTIVLSDMTQIEHSYSLTGPTDVKPHAIVDDIVTFYYIGDKNTDSVRLYYDTVTNSKGYLVDEINQEVTVGVE
ncbi:TPA: hypothetical protein TZN92_001141 [Streptococcus suis]|nr:hypothetical protein [Streptococcus suis]HEL2349002.1 hypothetical protein [Streptococcus suis]HEM3885980.1 hypothetical protein [Streptococcus suis]